MFSRLGVIVHQFRYTVIGVMVAVLLGLAGYGLTLQDHLSQGGFTDPGSESVKGGQQFEAQFGRDATGDVVALYTAPDGGSVDDPTFYTKVAAAQAQLLADHGDKVAKINVSYFQNKLPALVTPDRKLAFASFAIVGDNDTELARNFKDVKNNFAIDGVNVALAGQQPIAGALNDTMASDIKRMELLAIPLVGVLLFFVFGGVVAAVLPLIIGGLTVIAANGLVRLFTNFVEVNTFVAPVVSLIGLGLAIDYGLFIVSRFREELGDGYTVEQAVRRSVMTAGRTVLSSAIMIITSLAGLMLFPQGFLKSVALGGVSAVGLAAITSVTVLPAILSILGRRIDALGLKSMRQTKSSEEIEASVWGRLTRWVMRNPVKVVLPIVGGLLLLALPVGNITFGGINESYLPPANATRVAQATFDANFPTYRTQPIKIVLQNAQGPQIGALIRDASAAPGLVEKFKIEQNANGVAVLSAGLTDRNLGKQAIDYIRALPVPDGVSVAVTGTPAVEQDSINALIDRLPMMAVIMVTMVTLLMFLTFGSLVLPIKAILMTVLGLGATLGILTWIFVEGNGAGLLDFTPGPIMAPILVLIVAIIFGLSTDYEVFLLSRMVEARARGASTAEAIRVGTSHTGRIITAAALILIVVTGAFAFSDLVMMKYIAYGMIAALIIDATLIRMFLVPATMKMLGDDCWWAPRWMQRFQAKFGLGEPILDDERLPENIPDLEGMPMMVGVGSEPLTQPIPRIAAAIAATRATAPSGPPTPRRADEPRRSATGRAAVAPLDATSEPPAALSPSVPSPPVPSPPVPSPSVPSPSVPSVSVPSPSVMMTATSNGPAPRPIESWLAELRAPATAHSAPLPHGEPSNGTSRAAGSIGSRRHLDRDGFDGSHDGGSRADGISRAEENDSAPVPETNGRSNRRHLGESAGAISVSELIARQQRS